MARACFQDAGGVQVVFLPEDGLGAVFHEDVRDAQALHGDPEEVPVGQEFQHRAAEAAGQDVFFHRQDAAVLGRQAQDQGSSRGLTKRALTTVALNPCFSSSSGRLQGGVDGGAQGQDEQVLPFPQHLGLADGHLA